MPTTAIVTPRTPCDMFAALALSPTMASAHPTAIPSVKLHPPSPSSPFFASSPRSPAFSVTPEPDEPSHRPLTCNEARQLSLLLTQHLFPVRGSQKELMSECIALAEKLHEAGVRWDKKRRVMGMHLRGIWEEGQRLGNTKAVGGHGPMDLYVQGSFLTIAEMPHPLDPTPIPIEVQPATFFTALPKLTLQAGLASSLPAVLPLDPMLWPQAAEAMETDDEPPGASGEARRGGRYREVKRGWRERKKVGLKIRIDSPAHGWKSVSAQSARAATPKSARCNSKATRFAFPRTARKWGMRLKKNPPASVLVTFKSARRVSFGGWEVR